MTPASKPRKSAHEERKLRLAAALRENLKRRKEQQRQRAGTKSVDGPAGDGDRRED